MSAKKRLIILNHYAYAPDQGAGTRHYDMAKYLQENGFEVVIVSCAIFHKNSARRRGTENSTITVENVDGVEYHWIGSVPYSNNGVLRLLNMIVFSLRAFFHVRTLANDGDTLLLSSPQPFSCLLGYFSVIRKKVDRVYEIRDLWPQFFVDQGELNKGSPLVRVFYWIERFLVKRCTLTVSVLGNISEYFHARGTRPEKLEWVPNGISRSRLRALSDIPPLNNKSDDESLVVIYTGAIGPAQGFEQVVEAARLLEYKRRRVSFHFYGAGSSREALKAEVAARGISNVQFFDPVPKAKVVDILDSADALILPLVNAETFKYGVAPNKLFDYLETCKPILFHAPQRAFKSEATEAGVFSKEITAACLVDAVEKLLSMSHSEKVRMGLNARKLLEKYYIHDQTFSRMLKHISER